MNEKPLPKKWLEQAKSNLEMATAGKTSRYVLLFDPLPGVLMQLSW